MSVTYTKQQREMAKREGLHLITLATEYIEVQAPVSEEEMRRISELIVEFLERRRKWLETVSPC